jgi:hypothetical protein
VEKYGRGGQATDECVIPCVRVKDEICEQYRRTRTIVKTYCFISDPLHLDLVKYFMAAFPETEKLLLHKWFITSWSGKIFYGVSRNWQTTRRLTVVVQSASKSKKTLSKRNIDIDIYLTAIELIPGGSSTAHIYTQTVHRIHRTEHTLLTYFVLVFSVGRRYPANVLQPSMAYCTNPALVFPFRLQRRSMSDGVRDLLSAKGGTMGEKCPIKFSLTIATATVIVGFFNMPQSCDMWPTALLHLRRKAC